MTERRTWCGKYLCCREASHEGACEVDVTYLADEELQAIQNSANETHCNLNESNC